MRPNGPSLSAQAEGLGLVSQRQESALKGPFISCLRYERALQARGSLDDPFPGLRPGLLEAAFQADPEHFQADAEHFQADQNPFQAGAEAFQAHAESFQSSDHRKKSHATERDARLTAKAHIDVRTWSPRAILITAAVEHAFRMGLQAKGVRPLF